MNNRPKTDKDQRATQRNVLRTPFAPALHKRYTKKTSAGGSDIQDTITSLLLRVYNKSQQSYQQMD